MNTTMWYEFFETMGVRALVLTFFCILLYRLWIQYAQPFFEQEQSNKKHMLEKLHQTNIDLQTSIHTQTQQGITKKERLLVIKKIFLAWCEKHAHDKINAEKKALADAHAYSAQLLKKKISIENYETKKLELVVTLQHVRSNLQKSYHLENGQDPLQNIITKLINERSDKS